jgi:hypothetical protein
LAAVQAQPAQAPRPLDQQLVELGEREGFEVVFLGPRPRQVVAVPAAGLALRERVVHLLESGGLNYALAGHGQGLVRVLVGVGDGGARRDGAATTDVRTPPAESAPLKPQSPGKSETHDGKTVSADPNDPDDPLNDPGYKPERHARQLDPDDPDEAGIDLSIPALPPQIDLNDPDEAAREAKRDPTKPVVKLPPQIDMNDPDEARRVTPPQPVVAPVAKPKVGGSSPLPEDKNKKK